MHQVQVDDEESAALAAEACASLLNASRDPDSWVLFLAALRRQLQASVTQLLVIDRSTGRLYSASGDGLRPEQQKRLMASWDHDNPLAESFAEHKPGAMVSCDQVAAAQRNRWRTSGFFLDHGREMGLYHWLFGSLWRNDQVQVQLWCYRDETQAGFGLRHSRSLRELLALAGRSLALHWEMTSRDHILQAAVEAARNGLLPFFLYQPDGLVVYRSSDVSVEALAASGLRISGQRLLFHSSAHRKRFLAQLEAAMEEPPGPERKKVLHPEKAASRQEHELWISPIGEMGNNETQWWPRKRLVAVYLHHRSRAIQVDTAPVARLLDLSRAEARVAADIARGFSVEEIADRNGHSLHTVRKQLKSVFRKTGVNCQADLTSLILRSPAARAGL